MRRSRSVSSLTRFSVHIRAMWPLSRRSVMVMNQTYEAATSWCMRTSSNSSSTGIVVKVVRGLQPQQTLQTYRESKCRILTPADSSNSRRKRFNIQWQPPLNHNKWRPGTVWLSIRAWVCTLGRLMLCCRPNLPWFKTSTVSQIDLISWGCRLLRWTSHSLTLTLLLNNQIWYYEVRSSQLSFVLNLLIMILILQCRLRDSNLYASFWLFDWFNLINQTQN